MSCTAAHLRFRSLNIVSLSNMIEDSYCSWDLYTTGQLVDGLQQKKNRFSFNGNRIMSSFLGRQFYRSTLYINTCFCFFIDITFLGYIIPKPSFLKNSSGTTTRSLGDKGVHTFPKGICLKVNVIARLEFELLQRFHSVAL